MDIEQLERQLAEIQVREAQLQQRRRFQLSDDGWIIGFVVLQILLQLSLLIPDLSAYRIVMRGGAFALSLALLFGLRRKGIAHPTKPWLWATICILIGELCWHPLVNNFTSGAAQCLMYLAILAPLFWVCRLNLTVSSFQKLVLLLWGFHTLSSIVGILQVYYPDMFQFAISSRITEGMYGGDQLRITIANGQSIYRPTGLMDIPGGSATSGFYALLLGAGLALQNKQSVILRVLGLLSAPIGLFCIYFSQVRSILIVSGICFIVLSVALLRQRQYFSVAFIAASVAAIAPATFSWATQLGGDMTSDRVMSLVAADPGQVVYQNRGLFLEETINELLPKYPFGAGLGRWGMMFDYFGSSLNPMAYPLWAEIQWTAWLFDGGLPLILSYSGAIAVTCYATWKIMSESTSGVLRIWGNLIFAYNIGMVTFTFNYPLFLSQTGMEFWLVNAVFFVAARNAQRLTCHSYSISEDHLLR